MHCLTNREAVARALNDPHLDPDLRVLIDRRARQLYAASLGQDVRLVVVEGGDSPEVINEALGFPITGDQAEAPSYQWIKDYGLWFEVAYPNRSTFIFVENGPGTELGIHYLCLAHFWPNDDGRG